MSTALILVSILSLENTECPRASKAALLLLLLHTLAKLLDVCFCDDDYKTSLPAQRASWVLAGVFCFHLVQANALLVQRSPLVQ